MPRKYATYNRKGKAVRRGPLGRFVSNTAASVRGAIETRRAARSAKRISRRKR